MQDWDAIKPLLEEGFKVFIYTSKMGIGLSVTEIIDCVMGDLSGGQGPSGRDCSQMTLRCREVRHPRLFALRSCRLRLPVL